MSKCKTPGTQYFFRSFDKNSEGEHSQHILMAACLPDNIIVNENQMIKIEEDLHRAFENILAPLFG
jgi:hypothetical protein